MMTAKKRSNLKDSLKRVRLLWSREIWDARYLGDQSAKGRIYSALRILSLSVSGFQRNNILVRAAALSYSSLIALAPMVAIIVMISGFVLKSQGGEEFAARKITELITYIAPTISDYTKVEVPGQETVQPANGVDTPRVQRVNPDDPANTSAGSDPPASDEEPVAPELNEDLVNLLDGIIQSTQSGGAGIFGILVLVFIGIQLLISIENTLNDIWGEQRGRTMVQRVVYYWAFISLGSVLSFSAVSAPITASVVSALSSWEFVPGIEHVAQLVKVVAPIFSFAAIVLLLALFYRFFPNTTVRMKPALAGAICVALLLLLNNYLSFLYVGQVVRNKSLYGSIAIIPVLMLGMYIFWIFILTGGQITYAFQSAETLTHRNAWQNVSSRTRETLSLAAFILICRRFEEGKPPWTFAELVEATRAPSNLLNQCLNQLCEIDLVHNVAADEDEEEKTEPRYAPAVPADKVTLGRFKDAWESYGNNDGLELLIKIDPVIEHYRKKYGEFDSEEANRLTVRDALQQHARQ